MPPPLSAEQARDPPSSSTRTLHLCTLYLHTCGGRPPKAGGSGGARGGVSGGPPTRPLAEVPQNLLLLRAVGHHEGIGGQQRPPVRPRAPHQDVAGAWKRFWGGQQVGRGARRPPRAPPPRGTRTFLERGAQAAGQLQPQRGPLGGLGDPQAPRFVEAEHGDHGPGWFLRRPPRHRFHRPGQHWRSTNGGGVSGSPKPPSWGFGGSPTFFGGGFSPSSCFWGILQLPRPISGSLSGYFGGDSHRNRCCRSCSGGSRLGGSAAGRGSPERGGPWGAPLWGWGAASPSRSPGACPGRSRGGCPAPAGCRWPKIHRR